MPFSTHPSSIRVRLDSGQERSFHESFRIGRDAACDLVLESVQVSRVHARVEFERGAWYIRDEGSTNGTYYEGTKTAVIPLTASHTVRFGLAGPFVEFTVETAGRRPRIDQPAITPRPGRPEDPGATAGNRAPRSAAGNEAAPSGADTDPDGRPANRSMDQYIHHYFGDQDTPAGEHTMFIRSAFKAVQKEQRLKYTSIIVAIAVIAVAATLYGLYQTQHRNRVEAVALDLFNSNKQLDLRIARIQKAVQDAGVDLGDELDVLRSERANNVERYDAYIRELGLYRKLTPREQAIHDVARIFNESGLGMPAAFVGAVTDKIENHWLGPHRQRYLDAIRQSEQSGYTRYIIETLQQRGLPPEFFFLALQESDIQTNQVGPRTRWGIAKGMWQFIPSTAARFGLRVGPRANQRVYDPLDERHDFQKSTRAAAAYLQELYGTLAQASGLLVMASYNWGEHRIAGRLSALPGKRPLREEIFEGIPEDPEQRNYWAFLTTYKDRMPDETKNYVLEIFAAAVIGHNPRLWGLDIDNPIQHHIESPDP